MPMCLPFSADRHVAPGQIGATLKLGILAGNKPVVAACHHDGRMLAKGFRLSAKMLAAIYGKQELALNGMVQRPSPALRSMLRLAVTRCPQAANDALNVGVLMP